MKNIIIANWKCNPLSLKGAKLLLNSARRGLKNIQNRNTEVVICPPFVYLPFLGASAFARQRAGEGAINFGSQDCFWENSGAFTGEISPPMLKNLGCQYVILGHSERRRYFLETDEMINKKIKAAISAKLNTIFCIGETLKEREKGETQKVLKSQIKKGLKDITKQEIKKIIIAYEPIWAIGTGNPCSIKEAKKASDFIRKVASQIYNRKIAKNLKILYGGSVDSQNAANYTSAANFQGLLVGGASLDAQEFIKIVKNVGPLKF
jgi:triosephosphate isomerase